MRSSVRRLMLRATMPLTLGVSWADAVTLVESEALASVGVSKIGDLVALYDSFAKGQVSLPLARALTLTLIPTPTVPES